MLNLLFFFFFKQKTAYELPKWLEFRRVLFRSSLAMISVVRGYHGERWQGVFRRIHRPRQHRPHLSRRAPEFRPLVVFPRHCRRRSEERRVGKECRAGLPLLPRRYNAVVATVLA